MEIRIITKIQEKIKDFIYRMDKEDYEKALVLKKWKLFFEKPKPTEPTKKWVKETILPPDYVGFNTWSEHVKKENDAIYPVKRK